MRTRTRRMAGFTLIELMIGLMLGLMVTSAAIGIFISNSNIHRATESLGRIQENARVAFELMARDIREGGGNLCSRNLPIANVLNNAGTDWWASAPAIRGYGGGQAFPDRPFGSAAGQRVAGTGAIEIVSSGTVSVTIDDHAAANANFQVNTQDHGLAPGDILIACDQRQATIFQMTGPGQAGVGVRNRTIVHNRGGGSSPGNCSQNLGFDPVNPCPSPGQAEFTYAPNSQLARLRAVRWYVGHNGRSGRSLYQMALRNNGLQVEEVAEGITNLDFTFLPIGGTAYVAPTAVADWSQVVAVQVTVTLQGGITERVGTDGAVLQRQFAHVVTLRNRLP